MNASARSALWNRNLVVAVGTGFLNTVGNGLWSALLPLYYRQLGAGDGEIGFAFTFATLAHMLLQGAGGLLADRIGRRAILFAMLGNLPLFLLAGTSGDWRMVMIAYAGTRMLMGTQWPALFALISESVPHASQGKAFAAFEFSIGVGMTIGPALGALLISRFGFGIGTLMIVHGVIIGATSLARGGLMREGPRDAPPTARALRAAFSPDVSWFIASISLFALAETLTLAGPFYALFSADVWKAGEAEINLLTSAASFVGVAFGLAGGHWSDRIGAQRVIVLASVGTAATLVAWALTPNLWWGILPVLANYVVVEFVLIAQQALQSRLTAPETRASMVGFMGTVQTLVSAGGPVVGAALVPAYGSAAPFFLGSLIALASAWAMGRVRK